MIDPITRTQDAVRIASRDTKILLAFLALLLLGLAGVFSAIIAKQDTLRDSIREDRLWATYQFDREARTLDNLIDHYTMAPPGKIPDSAELQKRYDILYSRLTLLDQSKFDVEGESVPSLDVERQQARALTLQMQAVFDNLAKGIQPTAAEVARTQEQASQLAHVTAGLLNKTNAAASEARSNERADVLSLQRFSASIVVAVCVTIGLLLLSLLKQIRLFKRTSQELQATTTALTNAYELAEAGNRAKSEFLATIGHEIRTPLNAILGMSEILSSSRLSSEDRENVAAINSSGTALLEIINEILDFTKLEAGKMTREQLAYQPVAIGRDLIRVMRARAYAKGSRLDLQLENLSEDAWRLGDPTHIRRVLFNLMGNAIKFTENGFVKLRITGRDDGRIEFAVADTGIGIPESARHKLFKPFSQVESSTNRRFGGTGLGLAICKRIVEELGGEIGVESIPGLGSTFWFMVPSPYTSAPDKPATALPAPETAGKSLRILVAEDHPMNRDVMRRFLDRLNHKPDLVCNGQEAVDAALREPYDIIIMDMQMPVMDGIQATRELRKRSVSIPIVALTANASEMDRAACLEAGMNGFESKPVSIASLSALLGKSVADAPARNILPLERPVKPQAKAPGNLQRLKELQEIVGKEGVRALVEAFKEELPALTSKLQQAVASGDREEIDRVLHTMKGSAANLGLDALAELAQSYRDLPHGAIDCERILLACEQAKQDLGQRAA